MKYRCALAQELPHAVKFQNYLNPLGPTVPQFAWRHRGMLHQIQNITDKASFIRILSSSFIKSSLIASAIQVTSTQDKRQANNACNMVPHYNQAQQLTAEQT